MHDHRKIQVSIFGVLDIRIGGVSEHLGISGSTRSLLQYLICFQGRPARREKLVEMFWPDASGKRRRSSLNTAIWRINKALKISRVLRVAASADVVRLTGADAPEVEVDFMCLEDALHNVGYEAQDGGSSLSTLIAALGACEAEPLDGLDDEWAAVERERLASLRMRGLTAAMHALATRRRYDEALEMGRRILVNDPYRESAIQDVMCLHFLNGERARAIQVFEDFRRVLEMELGIEPMDETTAVRDYLVSDRCASHFAERKITAAANAYPSRPGVSELLSAIEHSRFTLRGSAERAIA